MKTFAELYEFAQTHKESRIPLRSKSNVLSCYSMYIYGDAFTVIIEGPNPYYQGYRPSPLFRISFSRDDPNIVYFNDLNDSGNDVVRNQHNLPIKSKFTKMNEFGIIRDVVIYLLSGFRGR